jgi:hypothetical protein
MSEQAKTEESKALRRVVPLRASDAIATSNAYDADCARWQALIDGGAVSKTEKPVTCIAKAAFGETYGWSPIVSVSRVYLVDGRPCLAAEAMKGLVHERLPMAKIEKVEHTAETCVIRGKRHHDDEWHVCEFTIEDAERAKLTGKQNWQRYPKAMLWARCVSMLTRELFPDVTLGAHTPDEIEEYVVRQVEPKPAKTTRHIDPPSLTDNAGIDPIEEPAPEIVDAEFTDDVCDICGGADGRHTDDLCPNLGVAELYTDNEDDGGAA